MKRHERGRGFVGPGGIQGGHGPGGSGGFMHGEGPRRPGGHGSADEDDASSGRRRFHGGSTMISNPALGYKVHNIGLHGSGSGINDKLLKSCYYIGF